MYHDTQLGIYNLQYFLKKNGEYIRTGKIWDYGACYFNLKHFSVVNDRIGRRAGTEIMRKYVTGLQEKLGEGEYVCHVGGDNFTVLFRKENLPMVEDHLRGVLIDCQPFDNANVLISSSAGFLLMNEGEGIRSQTDIMDRISIAENIARGTCGNAIVFFSQELMDRQNEIKKVEILFPDALKNEEFQVYYQPKVCLKDDSLAGAEALCRWIHCGEMVPPDDFVPILETGTAICKLDFYMLEHVCRDIRRWIDEGRRVVKVSVNMSRRHMGDRNFLNHMLEIIDRYKVPHKYIEIELTETTTEVEYSDLERVVKGLQEQGIYTSVDDFGMGFSSLNLIRSLPWDVMKIDKSFLPKKDAPDKKTEIMFKNIIAMANEMDMDCIVEGVESEEQVELLKENGCFLAQGYYFGAPKPMEEFTDMLEQNR
jgi:EAL domain-containing protein (putative c-di-GMP-specific phosphodiesterase class I)/GGDEF domain-containing protein